MFAGYTDANNLDEYPFKEPVRLKKLQNMTPAQKREKFPEFAVFFGHQLEIEESRKAEKDADFKARRPKTPRDASLVVSTEKPGKHFTSFTFLSKLALMRILLISSRW